MGIEFNKKEQSREIQKLLRPLNSKIQEITASGTNVYITVRTSNLFAEGYAVIDICTIHRSE